MGSSMFGGQGRLKHGAVVAIAVAATIGIVALTAAPRADAAPSSKAAAPSSKAAAPSSKAAAKAPASDLPPKVDTVERGDTIAFGQSGADGYTIMSVGADGAAHAVATLSVGGIETPSWIGTACVTGSGRYVAAAFGPWQADNDPVLRDRGAFGAIVDLRSGEVHTLDERVALKYHSPGCGPNNEITFVRNLGSDQEATDLLSVGPDGKITRTLHLEGQVTSPAPVDARIYAARGDSLVVVDDAGAETAVASTSGSVFDIHANADGGADFLHLDGDQVAAASVGADGGEPASIATAEVGDLEWAPGEGGANHLVGRAASVEEGTPVIVADELPVATSLKGSAVVAASSSTDLPAPGVAATGAADDAAVTMTVNSTKSTATQSLVVSTATAAPAGLTVQLVPGTPKCAVPRNNTDYQVMQPSAAQVEWAADLAVQGQLNVTRPAGWNHNNLTSSYTPSGAIPRATITGGGTIPTQVVLGVLAQESNMWQASRGALPGVPGNPLIADYYGTVYNSGGQIVGQNFANADCGYGVGQITDGMTAGSTSPWNSTQQIQIATDYAANIAATVRMLEQKWNGLASQGTTVNGAQVDKVENWYLALWAYNTGYYAQSGTNPYGVGWTNNPANTDWDPNRKPFLRTSYADAATPSDWPYQEKVLGWAERPLIDYQGNNSYHVASQQLSLPTLGTGQVDRFRFCVPNVNECNPTWLNGGASYCTRPDRKCWWHGNSANWASYYTLTNPFYSTGSAEPAIGTSPHPPACTLGASQAPNAPDMTGAYIVDDTTTNIVGCNTAATTGTFNFSGGTLSDIDLHQIGAGSQGHFWYAHTVDPARTSVTVTGTWTPPAAASSGWQRILVHIPDHGADTYEAKYLINTPAGQRFRIVNQRFNANTWVDLGVFNLGSGSNVQLSNATQTDYSRVTDIAFDAVAFKPSAKPTVSYVAIGDSYSAGEGIEPYYSNSDVATTSSNIKNACHRSKSGWPEQVFNGLRAAKGGVTTFHNLACSGSVIPNLNGTAYNSGEVPQISTGWLDENTTNVSIGIGGNDAGFSDILFQCIVTTTNCLDPSFRLQRKIGGLDSQPLTVQEPIVISNVGSNVAGLIAQVKTLAPNAKITVVGYPHVISTTFPLVGTVCQNMLWQTQANQFATWGDQLNSALQTAVNGAGPNVTFANPVVRFSGHEACTSDTDEWINAVVVWSSSGSDGPGNLQKPGAGTFHPKQRGADELSSLVLATFP